MGYDLHIERQASDSIPIQLEEWCAAVAATEDVRLFAANAHTITNPATREVISVPARKGDAEVFFPQDGKWYAVFHWRKDSAIFGARNVEPGDRSNPAWSAATALARRLNAVIRGDGGEVYDLDTGEVIESDE